MLCNGRIHDSRPRRTTARTHLRHRDDARCGLLVGGLALLRLERHALDVRGRLVDRFRADRDLALAHRLNFLPCDSLALAAARHVRERGGERRGVLRLGELDLRRECHATAALALELGTHSRELDAHVGSLAVSECGLQRRHR